MVILDMINSVPMRMTCVRLSSWLIGSQEDIILIKSYGDVDQEMTRNKTAVMRAAHSLWSHIVTVFGLAIQLLTVVLVMLV